VKLLYKYPEVRSQFFAEKNEGIALNDIGVGSRTLIWWKCDRAADHIWQASPNQRTSGKKLRGCPYCAGKYVADSNSLEHIKPEIAKEWNYDRNHPLTPSKITPGSNKKVWWRCISNPLHEWIASPKQRTSQNNTCPCCDSLAVKYPEIAKELHPILNDLSASEMAASAHKMVWWKCEQGFDHVWQSTVNSRTSMKTGCPICAGYRVVKSNSLAYLNPELAIQWDYVKNKYITPDIIYARSRKKVWWKCPEGEDHSWIAEIRSRVNGIGCPICSGRKIARSNSLANRFPKVADMLHKTKNKGLTGFDFTPYSNRLVWWQCPIGIDHEWQATVANVVNGSTCPVCLGRKITDSNNLSALFPKLIEEWDFEKNTVDPLRISPGSKEKAWWVCKRDGEHKWCSSIKDRTGKDSGCPVCSIKLNVSETEMLDIIKALLPHREVLYRYRPVWLRRMELDVFIPSLNLGIEYQGIQHFKPIDFFGGKETFIELVKRDKLKKKICRNQGVMLIEVFYDEVLSSKLILDKLINAGVKIDL
jgi:cytochrome c-type biogenesis protein CcmH/NrfF